MDKGAMDMVLGREPFKAPGTMGAAPSPGMTPAKSIVSRSRSGVKPPPPPAAALAVKKADDLASDVMSPPHSGPAPKGPACKGCGSKGSHLPSCTEVKKADGVPSAPRAPGAKMGKDEEDMAKKIPSPTDPVGTSRPAKLPQMHINDKPVIGRVRQIAQRASKKPSPIVGAPQNPNVDPMGKPLNPQSTKDRS